MKLSTDDVGLRFVVEVPNTTLGNDTYELVSRGDLFENSFAFIVKEDEEHDNPDKEDPVKKIRIINKIARLYDVSIVVNGAYANTAVIARDEKVEENLEPKPGDSEDEFIS